MVTFKWSRQKTYLLIGMAICGILAMIFVTHNQRLYRQPIARVVRVTNGKAQRTEDEFKNVDHQTEQQITAVLMNGKYRGSKVTIKNTFSDSQPMDQQYHIGDQLFLSQLVKHGGGLIANPAGQKRDTVVVFLSWLVITILLLTMGRAGTFALISVVFDIILFMIALALDLHNQGNHALLIFSILALIFTAVSLLLVLGPTKKMLATFGSTIVGTTIAILVGVLVLSLTNNRGVYYESMQYVTQVPRPLFIAEILLGSLGAVMDESSDIVATLFELKRIDPNVSRMQLFMSGKSVGKSIMGPLVNVLFLIFMADTFTNSLLYLKNGNSWGYTFNMNMSLGMVQSLISGIGIVLAVPAVSVFGSLLLGKRK
ncbi:YibE/F family protein [Limosilactobacillus fastidiosus]|uniref:YibE/F family protein n=1 Tax=Limosilactobacillus fastidiosus TaxID=2759855 RepID=A0A7W3YBY5_9LACO|nr:YibE/F family protein [Limosilactobacillus fastidiosus]MBB1063016.1 YibE/F family protein [Limosilactobacillus fastidiosus]MBB1085758.1 YibE/F family protein [Limosilactobacillus fastidiosus]MCD7083902.1 YibE/F family protein [Limosilactobacillus fastidiosus]MCD7086202.1 YibE/F family protein [Limosilactobacillus fastidiosus]MCD7114072.1 YibE/F family protein [Limosilactobacillus fastidiosus]